jgi:plasmid stabilization system protein ParE
MPAWSRCCAHNNAYPLGRQQQQRTCSTLAITSKTTIHVTASRPRKVYAAIQSLKEWPHRGLIGREKGTRELLFPPLPYIVVYRVKEQSIEVLRIYHGAQDRG